MNAEGSQLEEILGRIVSKVEASDNVLNEMKLGFSKLSHRVLSHSASIKYQETQVETLSI